MCTETEVQLHVSYKKLIPSVCLYENEHQSLNIPYTGCTIKQVRVKVRNMDGCFSVMHTFIWSWTKILINTSIYLHIFTTGILDIWHFSYI